MIYIGIVAGIFILEYMIKEYIERNMTEGRIAEKCGGFLWIRKYHNKGAFLNFMEKKRPVVAMISIVFSAVLTAVFVMTLGKKGKPLLKVGLALFLGGAYSNTYDRLQKKYVVDYFSFHIPKSPFKKLSTVVFNIADFCIIIGAMIMVIANCESK